MGGARGCHRRSSYVAARRRKKRGRERELKAELEESEEVAARHGMCARSQRLRVRAWSRVAVIGYGSQLLGVGLGN